MKDRITIRNDTGIGRKTVICVGDMEIPVYEADIKIRPDEFIEVTMRAPVESLDIDALHANTTISVIDHSKPVGDFYRWTMHPDTYHWHLAKWMEGEFGKGIHGFGIKFYDGRIFQNIGMKSVDSKEDIPNDDIIDVSGADSRIDL